MAVLNIYAHVLDEQEFDGDELYFMVDGTKVGPSPPLKAGESYTFDPVKFFGAATVELWEDDSGSGEDGENDWIGGTTWISDTPGLWIESIDGSDYAYDVWYNVESNILV